MRQLAWLMILVAAGSTAGEDPAATGASRRVERSVRQWNPDEEDKYVPPACVRARTLQPEGEWNSGDGWSGSHLRLKPRRDGRYDVTFVTFVVMFDYSMTWALDRTARVEGGAVILNRAVEDSDGAIYRRLWALEVGPDRTVVLAPTTVLHDVRRAYNAGGCTYFNATFECRDCFTQRIPTRGAR